MSQFDQAPDPERWSILRTRDVGAHLVVMVQYPNCTNYEGKKILVFERLSLQQLLDQKFIDPHFSCSTLKAHPVARFEPTERGWDWAVAFAGQLTMRTYQLESKTQYGLMVPEDQLEKREE